MAFRDQFAEITQTEEPLAQYTHLKLGGPAEYLVTPRDRAELSQVLVACRAENLPLRVLGIGTNLLVREQGVRGVVLRLTAPEFTQIHVEGNRVAAGGGAALSAVIREAAKHHLAGFESLVGIIATIGGALRCNAGDRSGEMADHVTRIEVMDDLGQVHRRERSELHFGDHSSDIEDPVVLGVEFQLEPDSPNNLIRRMRRAWIHRKATSPFSFEKVVRMFRNPRGYQAANLIDQAGLARLKVGAAEVSERNPNYLVAGAGTTAQDVVRLLETVESRVFESSGVQLERDLKVW